MECLVSTDDEAYTYNKRINRLAAVQGHRMIVRAVERGVPPERIAKALGLEVATIRRRFQMLDGICADAVEMLKDTACPIAVFEILRQMAPLRQVEAAELMIGQNNFSRTFAKALLVATPQNLLVDSNVYHRLYPSRKRLSDWKYSGNCHRRLARRRYRSHLDQLL